MDLLTFFFADLSAPAAVSLGVGVFATVSIPVVLLAPVGVRPLLARAIESEAVYPLLREWDNARHASREAFRDAAALLILLTTSPKGALR